MKQRMLTKEEKEWVLKAILTTKDYVVLECDEENLQMMFAKYSFNPEITNIELAEDLKYLEKLCSN